jgi:hypothetical protein
MADDSDLARLLPDLPPPRPAARDAAIAAAMRRFDGVPNPAPAAAPDRRPARRVSGKQIGAFASIVLVAGISLSIALNRPGGLQPGKVEQPPADVAPRSAPAPDRPGVSKPPATSAAKESTPAVKPEPPIQKPAAPAAPVVLAGEAGRSTTADQAPSASPPPLPPPAPPAPQAPPPMAWAAPKEAPPAAADRGAIVVTGSRVRSRVAEAASPVSVVNNKADEESSGGDIVITGAHRRPNAYAARGDWNACTVIDPDESLRGCKALIGIGAKGPAGEAAVRLSDGLALAWRGDLDGAIAAFDQAIALKPKFAFAYLNRGLAYQRQGEPARAAADFDLAIKYAPYAARGYYNRSVLRREQGNRRGADADANRAVELDPDYPDPAP